MASKITLLLLLLFLGADQSKSFKDAQADYPRVREAYQEKQGNLKALLQSKSISTDTFEIYLRAFKMDRQIELWAKGKEGNRFTLIKTYRICAISGEVGPKRKQGDLQIPEGFYHLNRFNPVSRYHLSLGINYPNKSDRILGGQANLGGDIFIHGSCVTAGCLPITNEQIKELYIFCVEARSNGQRNIPISIFPSRLSDLEFEILKLNHQSDSEKIGLWTDLKRGFDFFNETKQLPKVAFLQNGRHALSK